MKKALSFIGFAIGILIIVIGSIIQLFDFTAEYPIIHLEKGWTVIYRNEQYINTNLEHMSSQVGSAFSKGDTITLNFEKPLNYVDVPFPYLLFKTQFCAYKLYLDGELISQSGTKELDNNAFIGIVYNSVKLPYDYKGKKLSIKLFVNENDTKADVYTPIIGNYDDLYRYIMHKVLFSAFTGLFLILFGIAFLNISLLFYIKTSGVAPQVISAMLCIVLGLWMITAYNAFDFAVVSSVATSIEYFSMYLILPLLLLLLFSLHKRGNNTVVLFLAAASFVFALVFIFLHCFNIVHINHFQKPYYLMSLFSFLILILYDIMDISQKNRNSSHITLMAGLNVLCVSLISYALISLSSKFVDYRQNIIMRILVPSGCLFFVISHLLNHFIFMTRSFAQRKEYASLTQIAYIDNLTGVPNRASCDTKLDELKKSGLDYCLLSLDLNGLKEVNDNAGHPAGDKLLKSFSKCLIDIFSSKGFCYRVGGDEFLVVFTDITSTVLDTMLEELDRELLQLDKDDPEANHSVSYGYAFSIEADKTDPHSVFMLADSRMYEYKRKYYSHLSTR